MTDSNEKFPTKKVTVAELGPNLPIGLSSPSGVLETKLQARPWRLKEEKEIARIRAEHPDSSFTQYVGMILGTMFSKIGSADFNEVTDLAMRRLVVGKMYMPDVFYAYIWLRIQAIGNELKLNVKCPKCTTEFEFVGDLNTTEVTVPLNKEKLEWEFTLRSPLNLRGQNVTGFRVGQQLWNQLEAAEMSEGAKAATIVNSVRGFVGYLDPTTGQPLDISLVSDELDELSKYDLEKLVDAINERYLGPKMSVDIVCTQAKCKNKWTTALDWRYDDFFAVSSD